MGQKIGLSFQTRRTLVIVNNYEAVKLAERFLPVMARAIQFTFCEFSELPPGKGQNR